LYGNDEVNLSCSHLRLTRTGIFVILAVLVALLGAAAKHSQFDGPPHHGYLSKAIKMAGARINNDASTEIAQHIASPVTATPPKVAQETEFTVPVNADLVFVPLLSPPLRV
jgi:hypothetical protein